MSGPRHLAAKPDHLHFEPFVHLVDVDDDQALVAWGGFWFTSFEDGRGWRTLDDEELHVVGRSRGGSIGASSSPYGRAVVRIYGADGALAAEAATEEHNHVWATGLRPGTAYRYEVTVDGHRWDADECMSWHRLDDERGELRPAGRRYDLRFRTFPDPADSSVTELSFAALGDYGVGIQAPGGRGPDQVRLAAVLDRLVRDDRIGLVVTLGDNIYMKEGDTGGGSGAEDDDWYLSFYEPYRFLIARVPVYPAVGNHDEEKSEASDDRDQLADNHYTALRFSPEVEAGRASVASDEDGAPGLFYRFSYGRIVEFCCIDSSEAGTLAADRFFDDPRHHAFLDETFSPARTARRRWLIPFMHHPAFCAGPSHVNDEGLIRSMLPRFRTAGVRLVLAGHEHNFQHSASDGIHHIVSGAAGKLRVEPPQHLQAAHTRSWAAEPHVLVVDLSEDRAIVWPVTALDDIGTFQCVAAVGPDGEQATMPITVRREPTAAC